MINCISLWPPWGTLVAIGAKGIETRSWGTKLRGWLGVHQTKTFPKEARDLCQAEPFRSVLIAAGYGDGAGKTVDLDKIPTGKLVGVVRVVAVYSTATLTAEPMELMRKYAGDHNILREMAFGDYRDGRYGWCLADARRLDDPMPLRGKQGFFLFDEKCLPFPLPTHSVMDLIDQDRRRLEL